MPLSAQETYVSRCIRLLSHVTSSVLIPACNHKLSQCWIWCIPGDNMCNTSLYYGYTCMAAANGSVDSMSYARHTSPSCEGEPQLTSPLALQSLPAAVSCQVEDGYSLMVGCDASTNQFTLLVYASADCTGEFLPGYPRVRVDLIHALTPCMQPCASSCKHVGTVLCASQRVARHSAVVLLVKTCFRTMWFWLIKRC